MIDNKPNYIIDKFQYFIIIPKKTNDKDSLENTFFYMIDYNIINSISALKFIAHLPSNFGEYFFDWPMLSHSQKNELSYCIEYVYDEDIETNHLRYFSNILLGCVFISEGVNQKVIQKIEEVSLLPIVNLDNKTYKGIIPPDNNVVVNIYIKWDKIIRADLKERNNEIINYIYEESIINKTGAPCYKAPSLKLLDPLIFVIDRMRGLYGKAGSGRYFNNLIVGDKYKYRETDADKEIKNALYHLISEKYLLLNLNYIIGNLFGKKEEILLNKVGISREDLNDFLCSKDWKLYLSLVSRIVENFENLKFTTDMILCIPSINYKLISYVMDGFEEFPILERILKVFYDSSEYYPIMDNSIFEIVKKEDKKEEGHIFNKLIRDRLVENDALSQVYLFYALDRRLPYIRTRNIPASEIYDLVSNLSRYSFCLDDNEKITRFNKEINILSTKIREYINREESYIFDIVNKHGSRIKILSDLPIEWVKINDLPLCLSKRISRIPITPGNIVFNHALSANDRYKINKRDLKVLILNTLMPSDNIFNIGQHLYKQINAWFSVFPNQVKYIEVTKKDEFINAMSENKPTILIYYGHGEYDKEEMMGKLIIGEEEMTVVEIEQLEWKPLIAILGACETQVLHGTDLNVGSIFLAGGVVSVLGTFFPVDALHTSSFISALMYQLVGSVMGVASGNSVAWDEIIIKAQRSSYLWDAAYALELYISNQGKNVYEYIEDVIITFFEYCKQNEIGVEEWYRNRDDIFLKMFYDKQLLYESYKIIIENDLIIPSSLFFTSLGSPEKIIIERENETIQLYDLVYSFMSNLGMDDDEMNEMVTKLKRINTYQKYTFQ
jgi:hypothetical protein